jgi:hypothetical protein
LLSLLSESSYGLLQGAASPDPVFAISFVISALRKKKPSRLRQEGFLKEVDL